MSLPPTSHVNISVFHLSPQTECLVNLMQLALPSIVVLLMKDCGVPSIFILGEENHFEVIQAPSDLEN